MEAESRREMEKLYNAMLRRHAGVVAVLPALEGALRAMLPWDYRISRACNLLQKRRWFDHWNWLPADWAQSAGGAGAAAAARRARLMVPTYAGERARHVHAAEVYGGEGVSVKLMTQVTRAAREVGAAWAASEAAPQVQDDEARDAIFADESAGGCRDVERCLARLRDIKWRVRATLAKEAGLPPPREPRPVLNYHIAIKTAAAAPENVGLTGVLLRLKFRASEAAVAASARFAGAADDDGIIYSPEIALGQRNHVASVPPDADGGAGKRDGGKKKGKGGRKHDQRWRGGGGGGGGGQLFQEGHTDVFLVRDMFDWDFFDGGELVGVELSTTDSRASISFVREADWAVESLVVSKAPNAIAWAATHVGARIGSARVPLPGAIARRPQPAQRAARLRRIRRRRQEGAAAARPGGGARGRGARLGRGDGRQRRLEPHPAAADAPPHRARRRGGVGDARPRRRRRERRRAQRAPRRAARRHQPDLAALPRRAPRLERPDVPPLRPRRRRRRHEPRRAAVRGAARRHHAVRDQRRRARRRPPSSSSRSPSGARTRTSSTSSRATSGSTAARPRSSTGRRSGSSSSSTRARCISARRRRRPSRPRSR